MGPNVEVKAREVYKKGHPGSLVNNDIIKIEEEGKTIEESSKSLTQDVKSYSGKMFLKRSNTKVSSISKLDSKLQISRVESSAVPSKISHTRSKSNPTGLNQTTLADIPSSSDMAIKQTRKRIEKAVEIANQINEKANQNKEINFAEIFGVAGLSLDEGTLQLLKSTFSFATNMLTMNKEIAKVYFSYTPLKTRLSPSFDEKKLAEFSKALDKFIFTFADRLQKSYVLHKPELALSSKFPITSDGCPHLDSTGIELGSFVHQDRLPSV